MKAYLDEPNSPTLQDDTPTNEEIRIMIERDLIEAGVLALFKKLGSELVIIYKGHNIYYDEVKKKFYDEHDRVGEEYEYTQEEVVKILGL